MIIDVAFFRELKEYKEEVIVEFLSLPNVVKLVGSKSITLDFRGQTVDELVRDVAGRYGKKVQSFLLDESGRLDTHFRVVLNKKEWLKRDQLDRTLIEGDRVTIGMLVGGG